MSAVNDYQQVDPVSRIEAHSFTQKFVQQKKKSKYACDDRVRSNRGDDQFTTIYLKLSPVSQKANQTFSTQICYITVTSPEFYVSWRLLQYYEANCWAHTTESNT